MKSTNLNNKDMKQRLKQIFCKHNYIIPKEYDDQEERDRLVIQLQEDEMIAFSRLHRCKKCGKERMIGSGMIR